MAAWKAILKTLAVVVLAFFICVLLFREADRKKSYGKHA